MKNNINNLKKKTIINFKKSQLIETINKHNDCSKSSQSCNKNLINNKNININTFDENYKHLIFKCSLLSNFIYDTDGKYINYKDDMLSILDIKNKNYEIIDSSSSSSGSKIIFLYENNNMFVVFRGTQSFTDVKTDVRVNLVYSETFEGCLHSGFNASFEVLKDDVYSKIVSLNKDNNYKIIFTGHSYGAALASLMFIYINKKIIINNNNNNKLTSGLITFGCPAFTDCNIYSKHFILSNNNNIKFNIRVANTSDIITTRKFRKIIDFIHLISFIKLDNNKSDNKKIEYFDKIELSSNNTESNNTESNNTISKNTISNTLLKNINNIKNNRHAIQLYIENIKKSLKKL